jgi:predicted Zn-dependent protease
MYNHVGLAHMNLLRLLSLILLIALCSGCKKPGKVYFVPIGDAPTAEINDLVNHYHEKFGIVAEVLPPIKPFENDYDRARQQYIAEGLVQTMLRMSDYRMSPSDVLIGITADDIYPRSRDWQFCFGYRFGEQRAAVVSTARMSLHYAGQPQAEANLRQRLRKVVTKDIGILYFGKPDSDNPRSVMYKNILGIQELDLVSEDF